MDQIFKIGKELLSGGAGDGEEEDDDQSSHNKQSGMDQILKIGKQVLTGGDDEDSNSETAQVSMETGIPMLDSVFKAFDRNGDGRVNSADLMLMLKAIGLGFIPEEIVQTAFSQVDVNENDHLDFSEFMTIVGLVQAAATVFKK